MEKLEQPVFVTQSFLPAKEEYEKYLETIWENHWLTNNGKLHDELSKQLEVYLGVKNVTLFVNGHSALDVAIKALRLTGEVITTPFTFASTTHAIVMNGLEPVFADIKLSDYTIDEESVEKLITEKTTAIVAVHVYGNPCNVRALADIARRHGLKLIYDAAHAFGVECNGNPIGTFGDVSMLSFHATKVFHTIEGGALLYADDAYKRTFNLYKNFGITGEETVEAVGLNAKMNEFQAAMGLANLPHVEEEREKRKAIVNIYRQELQGIDGLSFVEDLPGVKHNYAYFPLLIDEEKYGHTRDEVFEFLGDHNVRTRKYFYPLTTDFQCFHGVYDNLSLPNSRYVAKRIMTLPLYGALPELVAEKIGRMISAYKC